MNMPFPGMDPYLEHPALWPGVHNGIIAALAAQLQPRLMPRYVAAIEQRVYVEGAPHQRAPDVHVGKVRDGSGVMAVAQAAIDAPSVLEIDPLEIDEWVIHVLDRYRDMKVVAVIEVVSPSNKTSGAGRRSYRRKQQEIRRSECHLIEIDLLRKGRHVLSVPEAHVREAAGYDYLTCVSRWPKRRRFELYRTHLRARLPRIGLPLAEPDDDVPLDVQSVLEQAYEDGGYMLRLRYDEPCEPPLETDDQQWANERWADYRAAHPELFPPPTS
jgi:hypothetical protein